MYLTKLVLKDFGTFEVLDYKFENKPILIQGQNETDEGQESNGVGKSFIQNGIEYSILKTTSRKIPDSELIRYGCNKSTIELSIYCPIRKEMLIIIRTLKSKGSSTLELFIQKDDEDMQEVSFATVSDGDKEILRWLDMDKNDIYNYFIVNKERYKSFFQSSNTDKNATLNRFSNASIIDGVEKFVESDVDVLEEELSTLEEIKTTLETSISLTKKHIDDENNRDLKTELEELRKDYETQIIELKEEINDIKVSFSSKIKSKNKSIKDNLGSIDLNNSTISNKEKIISSKNQEISELNAKLEVAQKAIDGLITEDLSEQYTELNNKLEKIKTDKQSKESEQDGFKEEKKEIEEILSDINKNLQGSIKCPKCSHEFIAGDENIDIASEKESKIETEELLESVQKSMQSIETSLEELENKKKSIDLQKEQLDEKKDEIQKQKDDLRNNLDTISDSISDINTEIRKLNSSIDNLKIDNTDLETKNERLKTERKNIGLTYLEEKSTLIRSIETIETQIKNLKEGEIDKIRIKQWEKEIKGFESELEVNSTEIENQKQKIYEVTQWISNFKKFNMFLANKSLKVIQGYCNKFLNDLNSDIIIKWEGKKILKSGELRDKITSYIIRNGQERDYWSFSGGERGRMDYALILTLQHMVNSTNKYGGLDFLSLDEVSEGIDAQGLVDIMKALSNVQKSILITTHVVSKNINNNVLLIKKVNGIATIN